MSRKLAYLMAICAAPIATLSFTADTCRAQIVRISPGGGVHVRAPFVRVDVDPYGGTSVRAPFTAVDVPRRGYPYTHPPAVVEHRIVNPSLPPARELALMDDETLWRYLDATANRLHEQLNRFETAASWQRYLRLRAEMLTDSSSDWREHPDALIELLRRFRYVANESRYEMIASLPAFTEMRAVLMEVVSRLDASPAGGEAGGQAHDEELPMPAPEPSNRGNLLPNPEPRRDYWRPNSGDQP